MRNTEGMNLYEGYLALARKRKEPGIKKSTLALMPLFGLLLVLLVTSGVILLRNAALRGQLSLGEKRIASLQADYQAAQEAYEYSSEKGDAYQAIALERMLFNLYPDLTREMFTKVRACAEGVFTITQYTYDENNGTLIVQANAASVNEVPKFVERLRETGLFRSVQYTGYTSDSNQRYYCTVGGTLEDAQITAQ